MQESFRHVMDCPGEMLSVDEGTAQASRTRNPIYTSLGKAKPLKEFRFFVCVDYITKLIINFDVIVR